jgi:hypothetical protein
MKGDYMSNLISMRNFNADVMNTVVNDKFLKKDEEGAEQ